MKSTKKEEKKKRRVEKRERDVQSWQSLWQLVIAKHEGSKRRKKEKTKG